MLRKRYRSTADRRKFEHWRRKRKKIWTAVRPLRDRPVAAERVSFPAASNTAAAVAQRETPGHTVSVKTRWGDDWTVEPYLHCSEAVWCAAPSIPTATLAWHYGSIAQADSSQFYKFLRKPYPSILVRIDFQLDRDETTGQWNTRTWYGIIQVGEDRLGGARFPKLETDRRDVDQWDVIATGQQTFVAYGLEWLLAATTMDTSRWWDNVGDPVATIARGLTFNRKGKANKHDEEIIAGQGIYLFGSLEGSVEHWSSIDIVRYLLKYQTPRDAEDDVIIPFALDSSAPIPDWDEPEVDSHGRSLHDLLVSVIPRHRLLSWYCEVEEAVEEADDQVVVKVFSFSPDPISVTIDGAERIPGNPNQKRLDFDEDPATMATLKTTTLEAVDQVVMRGARRISVCSLSFEDDTIEKGWWAAIETGYSQAASGEVDYPAATDLKGRRERNREFRNRPDFADVYSRFVVVWDWTGLAGDGEGGDLNAVFPVFEPGAAEPSATAYPYFALDLTLLQSLPLKMNVDYSGSVIGDGTVDETNATDQERRPFVAWKIPGTSPQRWRDVETIGTSACQEQVDDEQNFAWSCTVSIPPDDRAIRLQVAGAPQHVIADFDFTPLSEDEDLGDNDFRDMIATVAVLDDRYCEARYPSDESLDPDLQLDYIRRKVIDAGDRYRLDYVTPQTVVGIDGSGALERSDGGFVRDDRDLLLQAARVAFQWYRDTRTVLAMQTDRLTSQLEIGDLITFIGSQKAPESGHLQYIGSAITEIRIVSSMGDAQTPPDPPAMQILTAAGELDALRLIDKPMTAEAPLAIDAAEAPVESGKGRAAGFDPYSEGDTALSIFGGMKTRGW